MLINIHSLKLKAKNFSLVLFLVFFPFCLFCSSSSSKTLQFASKPSYRTVLKMENGQLIAVVLDCAGKEIWRGVAQL